MIESNTDVNRIEITEQTVRDHMRRLLGGGLNARIGLEVTKAVGTMWCAYAFAVLALVSLPAAISTGSVIIIIAWIAQTFLQLVLLSVIMVGQNAQATAADARAKHQHARDEAAAKHREQIADGQAKLLAENTALTERVNELTTAIHAKVVGVASA
jgi:hypothetical protein